jgi:hypothetical protein
MIQSLVEALLIIDYWLSVVPEEELAHLDLRTWPVDPLWMMVEHV